MARVSRLRPGPEPPRVPRRRPGPDGRRGLAQTVPGRGCGAAAADEAAPRAPGEDARRAAAAPSPLPGQERSLALQGRVSQGAAPRRRDAAGLQGPGQEDGHARQGQAQRAGAALGTLQRPQPERHPPGHAGGPPVQRRRAGALPLPHHGGAPREPALREREELRQRFGVQGGDPPGPAEPGGPGGYGCDYQNKRLPIATHEIKEWQKSQQTFPRTSATTPRRATWAAARPSA